MTSRGWGLVSRARKPGIIVTWGGGGRGGGQRSASSLWSWKTRILGLAGDLAQGRGLDLVREFLVASLSISLATSSLGAELERLPRPVLRPVPESSLTSGSSLSLFSCLAKNSKSSQSGLKLFSLEMV